MPKTPKILILAGRRSALLDPLAEKFGVSHKCLVPVRGVAMIARTIAIVDAALPQSPIYVSIEDFGIIADEPIVKRLVAAGRLSALEAQEHIVDSIFEASRTTGFPLIITTADNVLMTSEALQQLAAEGSKNESEALVVMARKESIIATHPEGQRRFYEFRDGGYSNCNLFWLASPRSLQAVETFRHGGQFAKRPERIIRAFGVLNLIRFRLGFHSLERIFQFISKRFKVSIRPLVFAQGRLAIDVDNERTHRVAEEVLARDG